MNFGRFLFLFLITSSLQKSQIRTKEEDLSSTMRTLIVCATILFAQGTTAQMTCNTADVATCFANMANGGVIDLVPGTMSSWDGISGAAQFSMVNDKYVTIACNATGVETCTLKGAIGKGVVEIYMDMFGPGGTTTLSRLIIRDGDYGQGGGLAVYFASVNLVMCSFVDNKSSGLGGAIYLTGGGTATLQGCRFEGNTAVEGPDIYNFNRVVISECPTGECPPPMKCLQGSALDNFNYPQASSTMTDPAFSYTCGLEPCTAGRFGQKGGPCTDCSAGKSSKDAGATSKSACEDCPEGKTSEKGAATCDLLSPSPSSSSSSVLPIVGGVAGALALLGAACTII